MGTTGRFRSDAQYIQMMLRLNIALMTLFLSCFAYGQTLIIKDSISKALIEGAELRAPNGASLGTSDRMGRVVPLTQLPSIPFEIVILHPEFRSKTIRISSDSVIFLAPLKIQLDVFEVAEEDRSGISRMRPIDEGVIYSGMKNEVIRPALIGVDVATGKSRQLFRGIAGLSIHENDGVGLQLGIAARGLDPNRTAHFNVRQDMHDISADALGYPESYYSPVLLAVEEVQVLRGAAALQFGTQLGGMVNFKMKRAPEKEGWNIHAQQSLIGFGFADTLHAAIASTNSYLSIACRKKNTGVFFMASLRQGNGWRENSGFDQLSSYLAIDHTIKKHVFNVTATHMNYLAQQPGGLTDEQFNANPRLSLRHRNWFRVAWNMASIDWVFEPSSNWRFNSKVFGLVAERKAVGHLGESQRPDPLEERILIDGEFANIGHEARVLRRFMIGDRIISASLGTRIYHGTSNAIQGKASADDDADFMLNDQVPYNSTDYYFPNYNQAAFLQTVFPFGNSWRVSPGARFERIKTEAEGSFRVVSFDGTGNLIEDTTLYTERSRSRSFLLAGISVNKRFKNWEVYANAVQNYRAINYSDIQVRNTSLLIDPDIQDEEGRNFDLGIRSISKGGLQLDASIFLLEYNGRIGEYFTRDELNRAVRYRTNIADARTLGMEFFTNYEIGELFGLEPDTSSLSLFMNVSFMRGRYVNTQNSAFENKALELVPEYTVRTGINARLKNFQADAQVSVIGEQFSDATNVGSDPDFPATINGVDGLIPSYTVVDLSLSRNIHSWQLSFAVNNLLNQRYFTRRATGYPGPGIIPSEGRSFNFSVEYTLRTET